MKIETYSYIMIVIKKKLHVETLAKDFISFNMFHDMTDFVRKVCHNRKMIYACVGEKKEFYKVGSYSLSKYFD